ncbi:MAG: hypothetical protein PHZ11_07415 [Desulfitobacteriaceae bacterium]|nr:hypothetical protein [Desulfitobacteriaceae bacterium]MDD4346698.1 hypothetical protein [Desulfitobacteriaceae bacterium]MDD4401205.1 hypothetical protein [Desulfitobacteriaceae bacterium]
MIFKKLALTGVVSLIAVLAATGIAGAANANSLNKPPQFQDAQTRQQTVCNDQAKCPEQGFKFKGLNVLGSAADLLGLKRQELKTELQAGKSLKDIAAAKGIETAKFAKELEAALTAKIDQKMQTGRINSEQAATLKTNLAQRIQADLDKKWDEPKGHEFRGNGKGNIKGIYEQVQSLLDIDAATLRTELQSGKSLADLAQAKGISKETLVERIQAGIIAKLDQAVTDQKITADKATKIKEDLAQKIETIVTRQHVPK